MDNLMRKSRKYTLSSSSEKEILEIRRKIAWSGWRIIGASTSGSKQKVTITINRLSRYPGLVQKLKAKSEKAYVFPCSLDSVDIPPVTAKWRADSDDLPKVHNKMFTQYVWKKREGSAGQQKKALQMFAGRKIVNVKTLVDGQVVYVKAMIKMSYGSMQHPTFIVFKK